MASALTDNPWPAFWASAGWPRDPVDYLVYSDWLEENGAIDHAESVRRDARFWRLVRHLEIAPYEDSRGFSWWRRSATGKRFTNRVPDSAWIPRDLFAYLGIVWELPEPVAWFEPYEQDAWDALRMAYWEWREAATGGAAEWPPVVSS